MNPRARKAWFVFGAFVLIVGFALFWLNREVLASQRRAQEASDAAHVQEAMRLALWRMDSAFAPVLAREALRTSGDESARASTGVPAAAAPDPAQPDAPVDAFYLSFKLDEARKAQRAELEPFVALLKAEIPKKAPEDEKRAVDDLDKNVFKESAEKSRDQAREAAPAPEAGPQPGFVGGYAKAPGANAAESRPAALKDLSEIAPAAESPSMRKIRGAVADSKPASRPAWGAGGGGGPGVTMPPMPNAPRGRSLSDVEAKAKPDEDQAKSAEPTFARKPPEEKSVEPRPPEDNPAEDRRDVERAATPPRQGAATTPPPQSAAAAPQLEQAQEEYQSRAKMAQNFQSNAVQTLNTQGGDFEFDESWANNKRLALTDTGPYEARWLPDPSGKLELFFIRRVRNKLTGKETVQGLWCDWPKLERWLVSATRDLFVDARLEPAPSPSESEQATMLATIPARLVPGKTARAWPSPPSATRMVLWIAWIGAFAALVAVGAVLKAALSLGERRGRFVSAVTHELRTPLTTFRMYSQMLAEGMVPEAARPEYLATLRDESERLTRVVESVLLYSRLEEGRGGAHREHIAARALVDRILPAVSKRAADAGVALSTVIEVEGGAAVELDVQAVEQIVLNLVDNACKYAAPTSDRLEIGFRTRAGALEVRCRDFGPGIPDAERDAVFLPFRRGAKDEAGTTPGVGLGLALARGLARALGGDLVLTPVSGPGACFDLTIPLARAA